MDGLQCGLVARCEEVQVCQQSENNGRNEVCADVEHVDEFKQSEELVGEHGQREGCHWSAGLHGGSKQVEEEEEVGGAVSVAVSGNFGAFWAVLDVDFHTEWSVCPAEVCGHQGDTDDDSGKCYPGGLEEGGGGE